MKRETLSSFNVIQHSRMVLVGDTTEGQSAFKDSLCGSGEAREKDTLD